VEQTTPDAAPETDPSSALRESYDAVAGAYAARFAGELAHKPLDRALLVAFAEQAPPGLPVADIGCGPGQIAAFLHGLGRVAIGVDLSGGMVDEARRLHPDLEFRQGSMLGLDFAAGSLAGIAAFYSVIHVPPADRPRVFAEFARVLAPGGRLLLAFHCGDEVRHLEEWFERRVAVDFYFLDPDGVAGQLADAGFTVEATLLRRSHPDEVETNRAYLLARR
jgi:SAM-dependent methyltransferase